MKKPADKLKTEDNKIEPSKTSDLEKQGKFRRTFSKAKEKGMVMVVRVKNSTLRVNPSETGSQCERIDYSDTSDYNLETKSLGFFGKNEGASTSIGSSNQTQTTESESVIDDKSSKNNYDDATPLPIIPVDQGNGSGDARDEKDVKHDLAQTTEQTTSRGEVPFASTWGDNYSSIPSSFIMKSPSSIQETASNIFSNKSSTNRSSKASSPNLFVSEHTNPTKISADAQACEVSNKSVKDDEPKVVAPQTKAIVIPKKIIIANKASGSQRKYTLKNISLESSQTSFSKPPKKRISSMLYGTDTETHVSSFQAHSYSSDDDDGETHDNGESRMDSSCEETSIGSRLQASVDDIEYEEETASEFTETTSQYSQDSSQYTEIQRSSRSSAKKTSFLQKLSLGLRDILEDPFMSKHSVILEEDNESASIDLNESMVKTNTFQSTNAPTPCTLEDKDETHSKASSKFEDLECVTVQAIKGEVTDQEDKDEFWTPNEQKTRSMNFPCEEILIKSIMKKKVLNQSPSLCEALERETADDNPCFKDKTNKEDPFEEKNDEEVYDTVHTNARVLEGIGYEVEVLAKGTTEFVQIAGTTVTVHVRRNIAEIQGTALAVVLSGDCEEEQSQPEVLEVPEIPEEPEVPIKALSQEYDLNVVSRSTSWSSSKSLKLRLRTLYRKASYNKPRMPKFLMDGAKSAKSDIKETWHMAMLLLGCNPYSKNDDWL